VPGRRNLRHLREELAGKFDPDAVEFLLETERGQWAMHDTTPTWISAPLTRNPRRSTRTTLARSAGLEVRAFKGGSGAAARSALGTWDPERFQIVEPGQRLAHSPDERILRPRRIPSDAMSRLIVALEAGGRQEFECGLVADTISGRGVGEARISPSTRVAASATVPWL